MVPKYGAGHENKDTEEHLDDRLIAAEGAGRLQGYGGGKDVIIYAPHYGGGHEGKDTEGNLGSGFSPAPEADVYPELGPNALAPQYPQATHGLDQKSSFPPGLTFGVDEPETGPRDDALL